MHSTTCTISYFLLLLSQNLQCTRVLPSFSFSCQVRVSTTAAFTCEQRSFDDDVMAKNMLVSFCSSFYVVFLLWSLRGVDFVTYFFLPILSCPLMLISFSSFPLHINSIHFLERIEIGKGNTDRNNGTSTHLQRALDPRFLRHLHPSGPRHRAAPPLHPHRRRSQPRAARYRARQHRSFGRGAEWDGEGWLCGEVQKPDGAAAALRFLRYRWRHGDLAA